MTIDQILGLPVRAEPKLVDCNRIHAEKLSDRARRGKTNNRAIR